MNHLLLTLAGFALVVFGFGTDEPLMMLAGCSLGVAGLLGAWHS